MVANWVTNYCDVCIIYFAGEFKSWGISQGDSKIELCVMCIVESSSNSAPCCSHSQTQSVGLQDPFCLLSLMSSRYRCVTLRLGQVRGSSIVTNHHQHWGEVLTNGSTYIIDCSLSKLSILILLVCVDLLPYLHCAMCWLAPARRCDWW